VKVWIRENRYYALLSNGASFGIDRYGNTYGWTYVPGEHVGRLVTQAELPERVFYVVEHAERRARSAANAS
jgi:hypothetical protein